MLLLIEPSIFVMMIANNTEKQLCQGFLKVTSNIPQIHGIFEREPPN